VVVLADPIITAKGHFCFSSRDFVKAVKNLSNDGSYTGTILIASDQFDLIIITGIALICARIGLTAAKGPSSFI
jgi:hypothetical protein